MANMVPEHHASERSSSSSAGSGEMMHLAGGNGNGGDRRSVPQLPVDLSQNVALPGSRLGQTPTTATVASWEAATAAAAAAATAATGAGGAAMPPLSGVGVARPSKPVPRSLSQPERRPETSWQTTDLNRLWCPTSVHVENQVWVSPSLHNRTLLFSTLFCSLEISAFSWALESLTLYAMCA